MGWAWDKGCNLFISMKRDEPLAPGSTSEVREGELARLSAFEEFVESLDLERFGDSEPVTQTRRDAGKGRILAGTPGHQRVAVFGVFDGIHAGHQDFLRQAREYGDELVVIVARDKSVTQLKGKPPDTP